MIRIAITGGIACGKSLVGEMFSEAGVPICDADYLAHSLMVSGTVVYSRIIEEFGENIIADNGNIDRSRLKASIIFSAPRTWQAVPVQTLIKCFPAGLLLNLE